MKETLEKLWNDYLVDECAVVDTNEERNIARKALDLHEKVSSLLNDEQRMAVEEYIDALCANDSFFAKKAFIKGCEFAVLFLREVGALD